MSQIKTKRTTTKSILARTMFTKGIQDALAGLGFDPGYEHLNDAAKWTYERGRLFYFATGITRVKQGRGVLRNAVSAYNAARIAGSIL
jgi:hypothetical protein